MPLERHRAQGILAGLLLFGLGFAVAAVMVLRGAGGGPLYLAAVGAGFFGVGLVAFFLRRGTVPLPDAPIWSPTGMRMLARALGLPPMALMVVVYGLIGFGLLGNLIIPMLRG